MAQKVGDMNLSAPGITNRREVAAQGDTYIVAQGSGVQPGASLAISFTGLPHSATWPRNLALALASVILVAGAWAGFKGKGQTLAANRSELEARRDRLFSELAALERQQRADADPSRPASSKRRRQLMSELESIYAALDA
jgi:outer membrane murein-binding lipoprotein Lpp